jgi:thiol-disulfide isomerase/thioredoxin
MKTRSTTIMALIGVALALAACASPSATPGASPSASSPDPSSEASTPTATPAPAQSATTAPSPSAEAEADALLAVELTDVRSGETFTLGELAADEGPVLLEPMAVWCTTCLSQQRQVVAAHEAGAFTSVSLDVDLSESPEQLADFADREGFGWRFAMADAELYRSLQERFGVGVTNPPLTPLIVIAADGTVTALEFGRGVRSAEQLLAEIDAAG